MRYGVLGRSVLTLRSAYRSHNTLSSFSWTISMTSLVRASQRICLCKLSIGTEQFTIEVWRAHSAFENASRSDSNRQADSFEPILMPQRAVATPVSFPA
jgi:hypothetical protein